MMPTQDGLNIDPQILIQTQSNFIAQARIREVQLEAAIQQLLAENQQLNMRLEEYENPIKTVGAELEKVRPVEDETYPIETEQE